jgi:hypothetical protein
MIQALLKDKLTKYFNRPPFDIEDLLTSVAFGTFHYVTPQEGLLPFLRRAVDAENRSLAPLVEDVLEVEYEFWEYHEESTHSAPTPDRGENPLVRVRASEPELLLKFQCKHGPPKWLLVEVKLRTGKSSVAGDDEGTVSDQLAKYWIHLVQSAKKRGANPIGLLYVTAGVSFPRQEFHDTQDELRKKIGTEAQLYWVSWRYLADCMPPQPPRIIRDLVSLFRDKWQLVYLPIEPWPQPPASSAPYRFISRWHHPAPLGYHFASEGGWGFAAKWKWVLPPNGPQFRFTSRKERRRQ